MTEKTLPFVTGSPLKRLDNQLGMTLIEVMIATAILAVIAVYTAQTVQRAVKSKVKAERDMDRISSVRDSLKIIERDINLAFHYRDMNIELYNLAEKERLARLKKSTGQGAKTDTSGGKDPSGGTPGSATPTTPPPPTAKTFKPKEQKLLTQFIGTENRLDFTSLNYTRIRQDDPSSDQQEVGYFLRNCRSRYDKKKSSSCLWRRVDSILDDDVTKGGTEAVLLENIVRFELRYIGPGRETDWVDVWKSDKGGDASSKDNFPYAVELTLETHDKGDPNDKPMSMTIVAAIRFPNNHKKEDDHVDGQETTTRGSRTTQ